MDTTTTTTTTYRKIILTHGQYLSGMYTYSKDAATPEIARELSIIGTVGPTGQKAPLGAGERYAVQRVNKRLGNDGDWHVTETTIVELL
jgi:hypothetical protein